MELAILLSTYNGMNYLEEQVSSLLAQTYTDWKLYIRDDASTDNTLALIPDLLFALHVHCFRAFCFLIRFRCRRLPGSFLP